MVFRDIKTKISRYFNDLDSLEDVEEMYDECIDAIENRGFGENGIVDWLKYYKGDVENLTSDIRTRPKYKAVSVHSTTEDAPPLVRDVYQEYKSKNPLLTGDETTVSMGSRGDDRRRFKKKVDQHIEFLRELKRELRNAKKDLDTAYRKRSEAKAKNQRGKDGDFDMYDDMGTTPTELKQNFSEILEDSIESDIESENDNEEEEDETESNIMMPYQLAFFLIKRIQNEKRDQMYEELKQAHPEQAKQIERNIRNVRDLRRHKGELNGFLRIDEKDIEYVEKYVNEGTVLETPQQYREKVDHQV